MAERLVTRPGAGFQVDGVRVGGGRVLVSGRWSGVRGMRFVRPTLLAGGREVLATLEHKPWAPDADPWVAAFPWEGDLDVDAARLSVAPSVTVRLDGSATTAEGGPAETIAAAAGSAPSGRRPTRDADPLEDPLALRARLRGTAAERDALRAQLAEAADERGLLRARLAEAEARLRLLEERLAGLQGAAPAGQLDEAVRDREAAMRAHDRMARQLAEAEAQRDAVQAQRDELALAVDALRDGLAAGASGSAGTSTGSRRPGGAEGPRPVPDATSVGPARLREQPRGPGVAERVAVGALALVVVLCALALVLSFLASL